MEKVIKFKQFVLDTFPSVVSCHLGLMDLWPVVIASQSPGATQQWATYHRNLPFIKTLCDYVSLTALVPSGMACQTFQNTQIWHKWLSNVTKFLNVRQKLGTRSLSHFCFHVSAQKSLSHSHSLNVSLSHAHCFTLSFTHSPHAEQLLFSCLCSKVTVYRRKLQCFFWTSASSSSREFRSHRAGSQLKIV